MPGATRPAQYNQLPRRIARPSRAGASGFRTRGEIDSVQGRQLRLTRVVIAPAGHIGLHSHLRDPTIVYVLSGVLTNHHDDGTVDEFHPGQVFAEYGAHSHWVENKGSAPVRFIAVNIHHE